MCTRNSPPQSEEDAVINLNQSIGVKPRCDWSDDDEVQLIDFLIDKSDDAGDLATFKAAVWNAATQHLAKSHKKGGVKTANSCSSKWQKVHRTAFHMTIISAHVLY